MDIYAEITKDMLKKIEAGEYKISVPDGVTLFRKKNSRACYFTCADESAGNLLMAMLDNVKVSYQVDKSYSTKEFRDPWVKFRDPWV